MLTGRLLDRPLPPMGALSRPVCEVGRGLGLGDTGLPKEGLGDTGLPKALGLGETGRC